MAGKSGRTWPLHSKRDGPRRTVGRFPFAPSSEKRNPPMAESVCFVLALEVESDPARIIGLGGALGAVSATGAPSSPPRGGSGPLIPGGIQEISWAVRSARRERDV